MWAHVPIVVLMVTEVTSTNPIMIGFDWGTSSLRAFLIGPDGHILDERQESGGVLSVPADGSDLNRAFSDIAARVVGDWLEAHGRLPMFACGMIGSVQGLAEAGYLDLPAHLGELSEQMITASICGGDLHIIPGVRKQAAGSSSPDVIRGEETQLAGLTAWSGHARTHVVLPGTHTKWAVLEGDIVQDFTTTMTGEIFGLLTKSSIISRLMRPVTDFHEAAYDWGLSVGESDTAEVFKAVFTARTWALDGHLKPEEISDYLSGVLIGAEVAGHLQSTPIPAHSQIIVCGTANLTDRYCRALRRHRLTPIAADPATSATGLYRIAQRSEHLPRGEHTTL